MGIVRFAIKTSVVGGVVYYTVQEGVWSKPEVSVQLYGKIYKNVVPYFQQNIPKEVSTEIASLPSMPDMCNYVKSSWNKGVITSMTFLARLPCHVSKGVQNLSQTVQKYVNQQS